MARANLLDREKLEEVTPAICACRTLGFLDLSANRLSELPSALVLPRVFELRLSLNPLRTLPPMVAQSRELHTLVIAHCGLTELPAALLELSGHEAAQQLDSQSYRRSAGSGVDRHWGARTALTCGRLTESGVRRAQHKNGRTAGLCVCGCVCGVGRR